MTVLIFIAVLVLLIVGHEFGHFIVAKLSKMRVDEFGIGFPPKIVGKKIGETEYTINWLPFGGFVKIFGEDPDLHTEQRADPEMRRAFTKRPAHLQAATLLAGPFANIILAVVLSFIAFVVGAPALIDSADEIKNVRNTSVLIGDVLPESPAFESGIKAGDRLVRIETEEATVVITTPEEVSSIIRSAEGEITVYVLRGADEISFSLVAESGLIPEDPGQRAIGIATALIGDVAYPPHVALWKSIEDTARDFVFILVSLLSLIGSAFTLSADVSDIAGPVGIASLTGEAAAFGLGSLLSFAALLSVNLAIINLLPFPALDGGRLLFLGIETVTRRKIPASVAQTVNAGGFLVLIMLMIAVTVGDISRLLG